MTGRVQNFDPKPGGLDDLSVGQAHAVPVQELLPDRAHRGRRLSVKTLQPTGVIGVAMHSSDPGACRIQVFVPSSVILPGLSASRTDAVGVTCRSNPYAGCWGLETAIEIL